MNQLREEESGMDDVCDELMCDEIPDDLISNVSNDTNTASTSLSE